MKRPSKSDRVNKERPPRSKTPEPRREETYVRYLLRLVAGIQHGLGKQSGEEVPIASELGNQPGQLMFRHPRQFVERVGGNKVADEQPSPSRPERFDYQPKVAGT